ncbi:MAG: serine/threonine-protein kinase [Kofleriaceae bacterium]
MNEPTRSLGSPEPRPRELAVGATVGDWWIVRRIAGGGFATVYEARDARDRRAALKLLHAHLVASPEILARFEREVHVIGQLRHPNIVELVAAGFSAEGQPYLCLELIDGEHLGHMLTRVGSLPPREMLRIFEPLCDALAAAHDRGIVHRDVKAANVMVSRADDRVVLLDFGIAKLVDALAPELTASHQALGTPSCMAPEQIHGRVIDPRTDVYALGALAFQLLAGRLPFEDPSATMTQYLHLHARRPRISAVAEVSPRLDDVLVQAMAIEPADRCPDVRALIAALRAAVRESASRAPVPGELAAILVSAEPASSALDEALLRDLEAVLPAAERFLAGRGFSLAVDLGSSAIFVKPQVASGDTVADAIVAFQALAARSHRDPRILVGVCAHREHATVESATLLRPAAWRVPEPIVGVWVTCAIDPEAPAGRRVH